MSFSTCKAKNNKASLKHCEAAFHFFKKWNFCFGVRILKDHNNFQTSETYYTCTENNKGNKKKKNIYLKKVTACGIFEYLDVVILKLTFSTYIMQLQLQQQIKSIFFSSENL